jgi:TrmH family RNA methyltransferase
MRLLTLARDLTRRKARERESLFVAEGVRAVEELLASGLEVVGVLSGPQVGETERGRNVLGAVRDRSIELSEVSDREFASAAGTESPQGVLAIGRIPARSLTELAGRPTLRLVILDGVQDPGNVGTILRTAAALGADATITLPGTVDVWNAKVVRSAMGAAFHHLHVHQTWDDLLGYLRREDVPLWAADTAGESVDTVGRVARLALAFGNEGAGLSPTLRAAAARVVAIPLHASTESLNVAVACGILLHALRP